jgi:phosphoglycerate kinase
MKTISDFDFNGKRALIRVDFNVPLDENNNVTDNTRIEAAKPTIQKILRSGGSVVLMSHLGRPKGVEEKFSLKHLRDEVSSILETDVQFSSDCIGKEAEEKSQNLKPGEVLLLENLRFHPEEKHGDIEFAKKLAKHGDIYVNDAFGTAHRAHASTAVIAQYFDKKGAGELLQREVENLKKVLNSKEKPVTAILGGAKVSSKIGVIENILDAIDHLIIGGGMTYTFVKAKGGQIGDSLVEEDKQELAIEILKLAEEKNVKVHLPKDTLLGDKFAKDADIKVSEIDQIPAGWMGLDIGPKTMREFDAVINDSKIILWNGPMGVFEMDTFAKGTIDVGNAVVRATKKGAFSLVGGGDSVAAVKKFGLENEVSYVSTGGGAMLEMLEGKILPGINALEN